MLAADLGSVSKKLSSDAKGWINRNFFRIKGLIFTPTFLLECFYVKILSPNKKTFYSFLLQVQNTKKN